MNFTGLKSNNNHSAGSRVRSSENRSADTKGTDAPSFLES